MPYYKTGEILDKAIEIERKGEAFYNALADKAQDEEMRSVFSFLAGEEKSHGESFSKLLEQFGEHRTELSWDFWDYMAGLQLLSDQGVFEDDKQTVKQTYMDQDAASLIKTAMQFERDSILYYSEMRPIVAAEAHGIIDELVEQERDHLRKLIGLLKTLDQG
ncbi:MAG: ferritin family protein [Candidatus Alcyoniella australis]|nr:ferritin family protein [Candidatus Alcyoniella australis]